MQRLFFILFLGALLISCEKEKLEGEKEMLIGTWQWNYSIRTDNLCNPPSYDEIITPATKNRTFTLEFLEEGRLHFYEDDILTDKYRIVFYEWNQSEEPDYYDDPNYRHFSVKLNNKESSLFGGEVGPDTMTISGYPFGGNDCVRYKNYFIKQ